MATITGFIERIKFRNEENGYTVMSVTDQSDGEEVIMVGNLAYAAEGDMIEASGHMTQHPVYGEQLQIESYEMKTPQDELSMERYLGSGAIKGIGRFGCPNRAPFQGRHLPDHGGGAGAPVRGKGGQ